MSDPQPDYCRLFIRAKRPNRTLNLSWEKFVVAVPLPLKCEIMRAARENRISQAQLGLIIVQAAFQQTNWLSAILRDALSQPYESGERNGHG